MNVRIAATTLIGLAWSAMAQAAPPIELELATERGVQITAPQEWLQLLTSIGIEHVEIRGARGGERPAVENRGTPQRPNYRVFGVLTTRDELQLPGGTFGRGDRARLKDYFARLAADGAESLTASRGKFDLTDKEFATLRADLAKPIDVETKGQQVKALVDRLQSKLSTKLVIEAEAEQRLREAAALADELKGVSAGTGLAIALRGCSLAMRPEKPRGQPVTLVVTVAGGDWVTESTLGKTASTDSTCWPIGWEAESALGEISPSLLESFNAEIDGYSLEEVLAAVAPRLQTRLYLDHASLAVHKIEPAKIQVSVARARISYKRLLDRVLAQARLGVSLRVDEGGTPFLWATR